MTANDGVGGFLRSQLTAPLRLALEARVGGELVALIAAQPLLALAPRGQGQPVLVLPRMLGSDLDTAPLRTWLGHTGFKALPWGQGVNLGPRAGVFDGMCERLADLHRQYQQPVALVGWSLGGLYARALAKAHPDQVRCVISLGTPLRGWPAPADLWRFQAVASGEPMGLPTEPTPIESPPPLPTTAIYSRSDGIVPWRDSLEAPGPQTENLEVEGSHIGLIVNPLCYYAIADRLAQPPGRWQPFQRDGLKALCYPDPNRDGVF